MTSYILLSIFVQIWFGIAIVMAMGIKKVDKALLTIALWPFALAVLLATSPFILIHANSRRFRDWVESRKKTDARVGAVYGLVAAVVRR